MTKTDGKELARAAARLARQVDVALSSVDLTVAQYRLLAMLSSGSVAASTLASRLTVRPPSVTSSVDGLVARGLVERAHDDDDRRRVTHALTKEGERTLASADDAVAGHLAEICRHLSDDHLADRAISGLALWQHALDSYRDAKLKHS